MRERWIYLAALVVVALTWALTFPLTKFAVLGGYRTYGITLLSSSLTVIVLAAVTVLRGAGIAAALGCNLALCHVGGAGDGGFCRHDL